MINLEKYTERIKIKPRRKPKKSASWVILKLPIENKSFPLGKSKLKNTIESKSINEEIKFFTNFLELDFLFLVKSNSLSWFNEIVSICVLMFSSFKSESYQIEFFAKFWVIVSFENSDVKNIKNITRFIIGG